MSITRHTIKRLERETEAIYPDETRFLVAFQDKSGLHFNNKIYKTIEDLKENEVIKNSQTLITIVKFIGEANDIKPATK